MNAAMVDAPGLPGSAWWVAGFREGRGSPRPMLRGCVLLGLLVGAGLVGAAGLVGSARAQEPAVAEATAT